MTLDGHGGCSIIVRLLRSKAVMVGVAALVVATMIALFVYRPSQPSQKAPQGEAAGTVSGRLNGTASISGDEGDGVVSRALMFTLDSGPFWNRRATDFVVTDSTMVVVKGGSLEPSAVPAWTEIARASMSNATVSYEASSGAPQADAGYRMPVAVRVEIH
jgi:hypothetical protein